MKNVVIMIPAYNPNDKLIEIVKNLREYKIIIINDGSKKIYNRIFNEIKNKVDLIAYKENKGKGYAIKVGLNYYSNIYKDKLGIVIADADGQHCVKDIRKIANKLEETLEFVIGIRNISKMPLRNKIGNYIMKAIINTKYKANILDTQTGLRGIPNKYIKKFKEIDGERFEYETKMLEYILENRCIINQIYINTIYQKNIKSKFNIINDSIKIIKSIEKNKNIM